MSEALFDPTPYGEGKAARNTSRPDSQKVEPLVHPWVLVSNRQGVQGFHIPKHIDKYSTCVTLCGKQGHVVVPPPTQMVRCVECDSVT